MKEFSSGINLTFSFSIRGTYLFAVSSKCLKNEQGKQLKAPVEYWGILIVIHLRTSVHQD
jgi:hypothetical protein